MEDVADEVLYLMYLELFVELFPDLRTIMLATLKKMVYCFRCLVARGAEVIS